MEGFAPILAGQVDDKIGELPNKLRIVFRGGDKGAWGFVDRAENFHKEYGVMGDGGPPAFTDQSGVWDFFLATNLGYGSNDIPSVLGKGVVHRTFRIGAGSVIVDGESAADIEVGGF